MRLSVVAVFGSALFLSSRSAPLDRITANDNRVPAGALRNGVLTLWLEVRQGDWRPDGDDQPGLPMRAFAEVGKPPAIPGPLIRVTAGTRIQLAIRNTVEDTLYLHGFSPRGSGPSAPLRLLPSESRELSFEAGSPGTYYYWGSSHPGPVSERAPRDAELAGAFVVDPAGTSGPPRDRVLVLAEWNRDSRPGGIMFKSDLARFTINGRSWPHTERLAYDQGDTVRFRIVNPSETPHPMHLHGFYFGVTSRGDDSQETSFEPSTAPMVVTERIAPGKTMSLVWVPDRPGNWLFHCHNNFHIMRGNPLDGSKPAAELASHIENHALEMMGGLVMGIEVRPKGPPAFPEALTRRKLRVVAATEPGGTEAEPSYRYRVNGASEYPPTILLKRGEPVSITVVNRLPEATAVHWHGIELDSYMDGVAGFSGRAGRIAPVIAPGDSFEARFTPPRSGTFIYHPHADEVRQQEAGLFGALLVVDDPATFDSTHDLPVLLTTPRREADGEHVQLNGSLKPDPLSFRVGERYRFRIISIHTYRPSMIVRILRDSVPVSWRAVAKDGMDLPAARALVGPAVQQFGNGETYDFEIVPDQLGELRFTVSSAVGVLLVEMRILVR